jgi:outer membrane protein
MVKKDIMKKIAFLFSFGMLVAFSMQAQKIAFVNTEEILSQIPEYTEAQDKLDGLAKQYQENIEKASKRIDQLYSTYQADKILLSEKMRLQREEEINKAKFNLSDLKKKHFGSDGDLYKERQKLIKPIQDKVYNAIQEVAQKGSYAFVLDSASDIAVLYYNSKYDKTDLVLKKLGYL